MKESLADNLNLTGTCRHNLDIRHKIALSRLGPDEQEGRAKTPAGWEQIVPYYNHTELQWINSLAAAADCTKLPFQKVEELPQDNGEVFFTEYLRWYKRDSPGQDDKTDLCLCCECTPPPVLDVSIQAAAPALPLPPVQPEPVVGATENSTTTVDTPPSPPPPPPPPNNPTNLLPIAPLPFYPPAIPFPQQTNNTRRIQRRTISCFACLLVVKIERESLFVVV